MEITSMPGPRPNQVVVTVVGDLDLYASVAFANEVLARIQAGSIHVVLDFSGVRYLDSSGVGALIRLLQRAKTTGGDLRIVGLTGMPLKVLGMSNILSLLKTHPDLASALKAGS